MCINGDAMQKAFSMAKHATMSEYRHATGFEALMGHLYLTGQMTRMIDLVRTGMERTGRTAMGYEELTIEGAQMRCWRRIARGRQ